MALGGSMTTRRLIEWVLADSGRVKRRLRLKEVHEAGILAVYKRYGDRLLFMDGTIFDVAAPVHFVEVPVAAADWSGQAVGVEFGWRHTGGCACQLCSQRKTESAA